jgi:HEAT repeat protein
MFRPPPGQRPGDPFRPSTPRGRATTAAVKGSATMVPWELWWYFNREPYLRLRDRVEEREVTTGKVRGIREFDRAAFREMVLVPLLFDALADEDEEVRTSAAVALGKLRARGAAPRLQALLRTDKQKQVRESAMIGLLLLRDGALAGFFRETALDEAADGRIRGFAFIALGLLGDTEFLARSLRGDDVSLRCGRADLNEFHACCAFALGLGKGAGALPPLAETLVDGEAHAASRGFAGTSIARLGDAVALPETFRLLEDRGEETSARVGAAIAAGRLVGRADETALDFLGKKALRDGNGGVRTHLAISLGRIGGERAATHLAAGIGGPDAGERGFFLLGLGLTGSVEAEGVLLAQFEKIKSAQERGACAIALALAGSKEALPKLRARVGEGTPGFLSHGLMAVGLLDDAAALPLVEKQLDETSDADVRREATLAYALLRRGGAADHLVARLVSAKSTLERGTLAHAIGLVGQQSAADALLKIHADRTRQGEERAIALAALGRIADPDRPPLLAQMAIDINLYVISDCVGELLTIL